LVWCLLVERARRWFGYVSDGLKMRYGLTGQWASEPGSAQANKEEAARPKICPTRNEFPWRTLPINTRGSPSSQHKPKGGGQPEEKNLEERSHGEAGGEEDERREQEALGLAPAHHPHIQREHPSSIFPPLPFPPLHSIARDRSVESSRPP
jgi:hypothetical protein